MNLQELQSLTPKPANPIPGQSQATQTTGLSLEQLNSRLTSPAPTAETPKEKPVSGALAGLGGVPGLGMTLSGMKDFAVGAAKSIPSTLQGMFNLGGKAISKVGGMFGMKPLPEVKLPTEITEPKGTMEIIGKTAGDIAQFFIPGGLGAKGVKALDTIVDTAKFGQKFGPSAGKALETILKVVGTGAVTGASTAGVTAAQTGGDIEKAKTAGVVGFLAGAGGKVLSEISPSIANSLQKSALRLTDKQEGDLASKLNDSVSYITKEIGPGTPTSQFNKVSRNIENYENTLQSFLSNEAKDVTVKKSDLISKLEELKPKFSDERDSLAIDRQIDGMKETLEKKWPDDINVGRLNNLKRSTYRNAYNKAGTKVLDWVEAYIGNVFKGSIEEQTAGMKISGRPIADFNKEYGTALQSKNILKIAKGKGGMGISGKALLLLLGSPAGIPGEVAGIMAGGTKGLPALLKTGTGAVIQKSASTLPIVGKAGLGIFNQASPQ